MSQAIESHTMRVPRLLLFYGLVVIMVAVLTGGLAYRQLFRSGDYSERERRQNQRRIIIPAPRGNILDREGRALVVNRPRFSVVLNIAELRPELRSEYRRVLNAYRALDRADRPTGDQLELIARTSVAQRYLDQVNTILGRDDKISPREVDRHFSQTLLLPFILLDNLAPDEYARLIERLPVESPLQVYASSTRHYPNGALAAHLLGYTGINDDPVAEDFPGDDLTTFKMKGAFGRDGLEKKFEDQLRGEAGGAIYRVDPAGYKVDLPVEKRLPVQGKNIVTSLDLDLQQAAEEAMAGQVGSAVVLDVRTGEVLVMASKPDYDLNLFVPRLSAATAKAIQDSEGWMNRAIQGQYPPGSTFKLITAIAGLRSGAIEQQSSRVICTGAMMVGNKRFVCHNHSGHGEVDLRKAIAQSCNIFFYTAAREMGEQFIINEARRFAFDHPTGIELPGEFSSPHVASPEWKRRIAEKNKDLDPRWYPGDTANLSIGQGDTLVSPLQVACMVASLARGETRTTPTILHDPKRPAQHSEPIGLSATDFNALLEGMAQGYQIGSGKFSKVDGLTAGTKSGTAQKHPIEIAWMVCIAPIENPQIAIAICLEGKDGQNFGGGIHAGPITQAILTAWKKKQEREPEARFEVTAR